MGWGVCVEAIPSTAAAVKKRTSEFELKWLYSKNFEIRECACNETKLQRQPRREDQNLFSFSKLKLRSILRITSSDQKKSRTSIFFLQLKGFQIWETAICCP